ncbi:DNA polymerase III subunit delta' [bacterium]|nr:DNA polymerase III subunit delta' [bacterium]
MSWKNIRGHDAQVDHFRKLLKAGRLPHALLFVGPPSVGKTLFARTLAQGLLCDTNPPETIAPCGHCPSCKQVEAETHPDFIVARRPEDKSDLPIKVIREEVCAKLALKPMMGKYRVAIVEDADELTTQAANAFLKTLEEPGPGSVLILIGSNPDAQLETIVSRCQVVRFEPLSVDDIEAILKQRGLVTQSAEAHQLALQAEGSVSRALALADHDYQDARRAILHELSSDSAPSGPRLARLLEDHAKTAGKEAADQRRRAVAVLEDLTRFLRDVLWTGAGLTAPSGDAAMAEAAAALASWCEPENVFAAADRCMTAIDQIQANAHLGTALTAWAHDLCRILAGQSPSTPGR